MSISPNIVSEQDIYGWLDSLSNWGRWGPDDKLGTLNLITPEVRAAAAALQRWIWSWSDTPSVSLAGRIDHDRKTGSRDR